MESFRILAGRIHCGTIVRNAIGPEWSENCQKVAFLRYEI